MLRQPVSDRRRSSWSAVPLGALLLAGALGSACSAIVDPDTSRLRPRDDGGALQPDAQTPDDGGGTCPASCDDSVICTVDSCAGTACQHVPDDAACGAGMRCNPVLGCVSERCSSDAECSDGNACNGAERCDPASSTAPSGCVPGTAVVCDDGYDCTADACDPATGACVATPNDAACDDGVDCTNDACVPGGAGDGCTHVADDSHCDDGFCFVGGRCNPVTGCVRGMPRNCDDGDPCDVESCDPDAMMCVSTPTDADMDGHPRARSGTGAACPGGDDCDDMRADVHPGAPEQCGNGRDDNCNGMVDEGCSSTGNDTCAGATAITIDPISRTGGVSGTFAGYADDVTSTCAASGGRDAWYYFDLTSLSDVVIDTMGSGGRQDTVLAVAFDCGADPVVCNDDQDPDSLITSRVFLHRVGPPPGSSSLRVYVMVDGYDGRSTGTYRINVRVNPARADSCATAPMSITGGGTVFGIGPLASASAGQYGTCQSDIERAEVEAVFQLRVPGDGELNRLSAYSTAFTPDVYVRSLPCAVGTELDCQTGDVVGGVNGATVSGVSATPDTDAFFFVDGIVPTIGMPPAYVAVYDP